MIIRKLTLLICLSFSLFLSAQTTSVEGRIFDGDTGSPLPFVTVNFRGQNIGTTSNIEGKYSLSTYNKVSKITISYLGYQGQTISIQKGVHQKIDIALEPKRIELAAAEVRPDKKRKNPGKPLMQRVADAKKNNDPKRIDASAFKFHERVEMDLNDIPDRLPSRKFWGPFSWVWKNLDSTEARVNLPVFLTESTGTIRTQKKPARIEKRVEAARASWMENGENTSSVSSEFFTIDFYENQFLLIDKAFTSPIHDRGNLHYRYYILDTLDIDNRPTFHIAFVPRRRGEYTFEGELFIDTLTLGLKKVDAKISEGASINYLRSMRFMMNYEFIENNWILTRKEDIVDFSITGGSMGIYAKNTVIYHDFEFAESWPRDVWTSKRDLSFDKGSNDVLEEVWVSNRPEPLSNREKDIYILADSVLDMPQFDLLYGSLYAIKTGYLEFEKIEIGPLYDAYSYNEVEGSRFGLELYTTDEVSRTIMPSVFVAYGTKDKEFKYGGDITWIQNRNPRVEWYASYSKDVDQLGMMGFFDQGNIFNTVLYIGDAQNRLSMVTVAEASFLGEFGKGFTSFVELRHRKVEGRGELDFDLEGNDQALITAESTFQLRYAKNEKFVAGATERYSLGTRAPIFTLTTTQGWKGIAGSQFRYGRYTLGVEGKWRMGPLGRIDWNTEAGTYSGVAPYPLLELQPANETALSIRNAFNLLEYFEYVTDSWARGIFEWHGEGVILGRIPLIKELNLREVVGVKGVYGGWMDKHEEILELPENSTGLNGFYGEAVFGIENILQFIRVDFNMRLNQLTEDTRKNMGVRVGIAVEL